MAGNDREPIGRKGKSTHLAKTKGKQSRLSDDDYTDEDYDDDYEDEDAMPPVKKKELRAVARRKTSLTQASVKAVCPLFGGHGYLWRLSRSANS